MSNSRTTDEAEVGRFSQIAHEWWDEGGKFRPLHKLNPVRLRYVREQVCGHLGLDKSGLRPFRGLQVLDVGCGGGLVAEPLARLGARVTGLDASAETIKVARLHAQQSGVDVDYICGAAEDLAGQKKKYDVVTALEIVEHVADVPEFVSACATLVKPGGLLIMSTLNRTGKSFALGIVAAEYILRWVPRGTHSWKKFLRPSELSRQVQLQGLETVDISGLVFDPLRDEFSLSSRDLDVNYLLTARKP